MSSEEYEATAQQLRLIAQLALSLDLKAFLEHIEAADIMGPMLDPTAYMRHGSRNLDHAKKLAQAARGLQKAAEDVGIKPIPD